MTPQTLHIHREVPHQILEHLLVEFAPQSVGFVWLPHCQSLGKQIHEVILRLLHILWVPDVPILDTRSGLQEQHHVFDPEHIRLTILLQKFERRSHCRDVNVQLLHVTTCGHNRKMETFEGIWFQRRLVHEDLQLVTHTITIQSNAAQIVAANVDRFLRAVRTSTTLLWRLTLWTLQRENSDILFGGVRWREGDRRGTHGDHDHHVLLEAPTKTVRQLKAAFTTQEERW